MGLRFYNIDIFKLSNQSHDFDFDFDDQFFEEFEDSVVKKGLGKVHLVLEKSETMIKLTFDIEGSVELECDRSLEKFDFPIHTKRSLILKYGDDWQELSDEIVIIPRDSERINIAQFVYEFIGLAVPMKRLHPKFDQEEQSDDSEIVYSSQDEEEENNEGSIDPRWSKLKNLK